MEEDKISEKERASEVFGMLEEKKPEVDPETKRTFTYVLNLAVGFVIIFFLAMIFVLAYFFFTGKLQ